MIKRISNTINILDIEKYNSLVNDYYNVIDSLSKRFIVTENYELGKLVNFKSNLKVPKHNWFNYKQGYASRLVKQIIEWEKKNLVENSVILDPFCGVGTTNLESQILGYSSVGYDINPIALLIAKTKTTFYTKQELGDILEKINKFKIEINDIKRPEIPEAKVLISSFSHEILENLFRILKWTEQIEEIKTRDFFKLVLISTVDPSSCRVKDGNGIKLSKTKKVVENTFEFYFNTAMQFYKDIEEINLDVPVSINEGSYYKHEDNNDLYDLIIYSPPYANCFDYFEVYKLEMWVAGFISKYSDFEAYRNLAMRSHVNAKFSHDFTNNYAEIKLISDLIRTTNVWNKNIPDMIMGYFDDMSTTLELNYKQLKKGKRCYIVVANSGYRGILVPTDLLLAKIASNYGFKIVNIFHTRDIRSSSQQMNILKNGYNKLMRESIIVLEK